MMRIRVKFFAVLRDAAGAAETQIEAGQRSTVADAVQIIALRFPAIANHLKRAAVAVNQEYASRETELHDGDELALIPPVSGG